MNQDLYDKIKKTIKKETYMKYYDASDPLYLETDASGVSLGAGLLKEGDGMNCESNKVLDNAPLCPVTFVSRSLLCDEWCYSNIEWEVLGILHALKKFHHYHFAEEVCIITDHKLLLVVIRKGAGTLSQHMQCLMLHFHQYRVYIIYKYGSNL